MISAVSVPRMLRTRVILAGLVRIRSRAKEDGVQHLGKIATSVVVSLLGAEVAKAARTF